MLRFVSRLPVFVPIVILLLPGSMEFGAQCASAQTASQPVLPANTPVILRLTKSLASKDAKPGTLVEFEVAYDVVVNDQILIRMGTAVEGSLRQVDRAGDSPAKLDIDLGPTQTVSGGAVSFSRKPTRIPSNQGGGDLVSMGAEAWPLLPAFAIADLFSKKVVLDKDAWGGVWGVVHVAEDVPLDPAKQRVAQEQFNASQKAAREKFCKMVTPPISFEALQELRRESGYPDSQEAELLHRAGDLDEAIRVNQKLLASHGDPSCPFKELWASSDATLHLTLAQLWQEKHDFARALTECRTAVQLDPKDERGRIGLVETLEDSGDLDAAVAEANEAIRTLPDKPFLHYVLGRALVKKNDPDAAIVELQRALKEYKNHLSPANCELGRAFELKGDIKAAFLEYRTAFRAHDGDTECHAAYERLQSQLKK